MTRRPMTKTLLVLSAHLAALLVAVGVVAIHAALTDGPDRIASSGMHALGDLLLFLGAFTVAAMPASGLALYYLRAAAGFWRLAGGTALAVAATSLLPLADYLGFGNGADHPAVSLWSPLRALAAPFLAGAFLFAGLFAPTRGGRLALFAAAGIETAAFIGIGSILMRSNS